MTHARRRKPNHLWLHNERIYIPCPLPIKNRFGALSRKLWMSEAEVGFAIVTGCLDRDEMLQALLDLYQARKVELYDSLLPHKIRKKLYYEE